MDSGLKSEQKIKKLFLALKTKFFSQSITSCLNTIRRNAQHPTDLLGTQIEPQKRNEPEFILGKIGKCLVQT